MTLKNKRTARPGEGGAWEGPSPMATWARPASFLPENLALPRTPHPVSTSQLFTHDHMTCLTPRSCKVTGSAHNG